jgi:hypothetical protein
MSYAVRNDRRGFRAVNGPDDCAADEFFSVEVPGLVTPPLTREEIEELRLRAYADPVMGSDRYFAEAQRESLLGNAAAAESAKALGMARFAEIQAEYPWPAE